MMKQPSNGSPKTTYYIRIVGGGYLLYTAYALNADWVTVKPEHKLFIGAAIVLFVLAGFLLCLFSLLSLIKLNRTQSEQEEAVETDEEAPEADSSSQVDMNSSEANPPE